jgi:hypothetical protein
MNKKEGSPDKKRSKEEIEEALIENFINLQRVLTNLAVKFDDLSNNISKLLQLFEISAKSFAEKYSGNYPGGEADGELLKKLDSLLDQNKVISKGIMLMEEKIRGRSPQEQMRESNMIREQMRPRTLPSRY